MENCRNQPNFRGQNRNSRWQPVIKLTNVFFSYPEKSFELSVPSLEIISGNKVAVTGESGSGKSTLLQLMAGIYVPESGSVQIDDIVLSDYSYTDRQDFRLIRMGLVFQEFELLDYLSLVDNVTLPYRTSPILSYTNEIRQYARELLSVVGLADKEKRKPAQLSQGERQRVAICRSLITRPELLLCDEPTGNLDTKNRDIVLDTLNEYAGSAKATLVFVTHDETILPSFDRILRMEEFYIDR